jgi:hypothetical protein
MRSLDRSVDTYACTLYICIYSAKKYYMHIYTYKRPRCRYVKGRTELGRVGGDAISGADDGGRLLLAGGRHAVWYGRGFVCVCVCVCVCVVRSGVSVYCREWCVCVHCREWSVCMCVLDEMCVF